MMNSEKNLLNIFKNSLSSLYLRVIATALFLLIVVFFILKHGAIEYSPLYSHDTELRLEDIKTQIQNIAFSLPDSLFSSTRSEFLHQVKEKNPLIEQLENSMEQLKGQFSEKQKSLDGSENQVFQLYNFLNINIKKLDITLNRILQSQEFEDISPYVQDIVKISQKFSDYSATTPKAPNMSEAISKFSLKKQN